jgi:hypothetical protein
MARRMVASAAAALALLLAASAFDTADARRGGGFHGGGFRSGGHFAARSFGGTRFVGRPHFAARSAFVGRRAFRRGVIVGAPLAYGAYYYGGYGGDCYWLRRRALATGSGYWWDRYNACINGYY